MAKRNGDKLTLTIILTCLLSFGWFFIPIYTTHAQSPGASPTVAATPTATPPQQQQVALTMADNLRNATGEIIAARQSFILSVERPLFGWLMVLAQVIALIMFSWAIVAGIFVNGGFSSGDIYRIGMRAAVGFLLLFLAGDLNNDGVKGDLLNYPASVGAYYAYGVDALGNQEDAYLARTTRQKEEEFDAVYRKFVENKLMVRVNGADLPVQYPTAKDINLLSALYIGKFENEEDFERAKSREWQMSILYSSLDFTRGLLVFADLFLFLMQGFAVICLRLALPLMIGMMFYKEYGQKITISYFWTAAVFCLLFPGVTQFLRIMFYGAGSVVLGIGGDNPYYMFDPESGKIIANGNPEAVILIGIIYMGFSALTMFASFFISIYISQGKVLEGIVSTFSGWFTAATSIGIGVGTGAAASRMNLDAEQTQQQGIQDAAMAEAGYVQQVSETGAQGSNKAANLLTDGRLKGAEYSSDQTFQGELARIQGQTESANLGIWASQIKEWAGIQAKKNEAISNAGMNLKQEWGSLDADARKEQLMNVLELAKDNNMADAKELVDRVKQHPELMELGGKNFEELENKFPVVGQIMKTAGLNADFYNTWSKNATVQSLGINPQGAANQFGMYDDLVKSVNGGQESLKNMQASTPQDQSYGMNSGDAQQGMARMRGKGVTGNWVAQVANNEMTKLGYTPQGRLAMLGNLGRENSWNAKTIFAGHSDPANSASNLGIISWQGSRRTALLQHLQKEGYYKNGQVVESEGSLRSMVRFMDKEMKTGRWGNQAAVMRNNNLSTQDVSKSLQKYILYSRDKQYNTPDANFDVANNRIWADKAKGLVFSTTPGQTFKDIERGTLAEGKVLANQRAITLEKEATKANNQFFFSNKQGIADTYYESKGNLAGQRYADTVGIAEKEAGFSEKYRQQSESLSYQATAITDRQSRIGAAYQHQGSTGQARIVAFSEQEANKINLATSMKQAALAFEGRQVATRISYDAAMKAAQTRAMASMLQNVGDKAGHHLSEAAEKFSRL